MLLSIDFDYFIREKIIWDFGHSEERPGLFGDVVWQIRYSNVDLYEETDPEKYADFDPTYILKKLREKKININSKTQLCLAESHEKAYSFFANGGKPKLLIHIDAHHDMFTKGTLNCGNWLYHLLNKFPDMKVFFIYPKWSLDESWIDRKKEIKKTKPLKWMTYDKLPVINEHVDKLFICRSGIWTPPHHDKLFQMMVETIAYFSGITPQNVIQFPFIKRTSPTRKKAKQAYKEHQKQIEELKKRAMEKK